MSIATVILADSPVVYYKLDELSGTAATDATGGGRTGLYQGGVTYGIVGPEAGTTAVRFIAPNGYVIYNAQTPVLSPPWTLECWMALTAQGKADQYTIANTGAPTVGAGLLFQPSGGNTTFNVVRSNIGFSSSAGLITDTNWHHVVWTIDGSNNLCIYVDGVRVLNQASQNVNANNSTSRWRTGTPTAGDTPCAYAHTALYNVALSPAQVNTHFISATTPPPTTPTGLSAIAVSPSQINLSWTASTGGGGVTGYSVERCAGAGCSDFSVIGTPTGTTFSDTGLVQNTTYQYRVRANSAVGFGGYSATVSATTQILAGVSWSVDRFALNGMISPMTTQDDIILGGIGGTPARLAKGSDGQVLTVDSTSHHLVWQTPASGGMTQAQADLRYLQLSGGTLTGLLTLSADPSLALQAATKQYADTKITQAQGDARYQTPAQAAALYLPLGGGTLTGTLTTSANLTIGTAGTFTAQAAGDLRLNANLSPTTTATRSLGATALRWAKLWAVDGEFTNVPTVGGVALPTSAGIATLYLPLAGGTLTGNLLFSADNSFDIGASGATRPRNLFLAGSITAGGNVTIGSSAALQTSAGDLNLGAAAALYWRIQAGSGTMYPITTNGYDLGGSGNTIRSLYLGTSADIGRASASWVTIMAPGQGNLPGVSVAGAATDIGFTIASKGTGSITLLSGNGYNFVANFIPVVSGTNYFQFLCGATTIAPVISAVGGDTNIHLGLTAKGTGMVYSTSDFKVGGKVGFNNTNPVAKPTVSGAKGSNAALGSLIAALVSYGLITDTTTT